jgi:preprotein translocase subunit SecA
MTSGFMGAATRLAARVFGTKHEKDIKRVQPLVEDINAHFETLSGLSDEELRGRTATWQSEFQAIWNDPETEEEAREALVREHMDEILPEAFAVVKEACRRHVGQTWPVVGIETSWDMVPFDVQLIGGIVLHEGKIAEMATGEGKTLVALMPLYLNALPKRGCHLVTVNDYLARRDSEWVGHILTFLGLRVGCIQHDLSPTERREQYGSDVTYGTNNEFGFDYLRDNMAISIEDRVQRGFWYAIVDEVDSVLIDEARTPLIISGPVAHSVQHYESLRPAIERVVRRQSQTTNTLLVEAEKLIQEGAKGAEGKGDDREWQLGVKLLQVRRGAPKNKRFMKLLADDPGLNRLIQKTELEFIRDKKMNELDAELCYAIDEKSHAIDLTDKGRETVAPNDPEMFVLPDLSTQLEEIDQMETDPIEKAKAKDTTYREYAERADRVHTALQMLKAYSLYEKDVEYVIQEGKILIVDEFTGRLMPGRRYSDGLHQAIEAKEGVKVEGETQTLATITLQNFFRMYRKLAGMTGTAETEAGEFFQIYKLDTVVIPTHRPTRRIDFEDVIFRTRREKYNAIIDEIVELNKMGIPVLVGTVSVEVSETLSRLLTRRGIRHAVLNAKHHQREAEIVSLAGQLGAVVIATNMAGRGTDIKLGTGVLDGSTPQTDSKGKITDQNQVRGLAIIGTERHESRRIDRQLRGRSGRQGDPGSSRFFLSLEDDLMRLFGAERISGIMEKLGVEDGEVIEHPWVTKAIERAQKRVEEHNFSIRKHLLEYDDVMNKQREVIYEQRLRVLEGQNLKDAMLGYLDDYVASVVENNLDTDLHPDEWNLKDVAAELELNLLNPFPVDGTEGDRLDLAYVAEHFQKLAREAYERKETELTEPIMREVERRVALSIIDDQWRDHLHEIDLIKEGIGLRAWGQKDPLLEYKKETFNTFSEMNDQIRSDTIKRLFRVSLVAREAPAPPQPSRRPAMAAQTSHSAFSAFSAPTSAGMAGPASEAGGGDGGSAPFGSLRREAPPRPAPTEPVRVADKVGRNDPCPCGSGKKYKKCHGAV